MGASTTPARAAWCNEGMEDAYMVRGSHGLVPYRTLESHGSSINQIKEWRERQYDAGEPSGLDDFYAAHGLCFDCSSSGVQMVGWSSPTPEELARHGDLEPDEDLPVYEVCATCAGGGEAGRAAWKRPSLRWQSPKN